MSLFRLSRVGFFTRRISVRNFSTEKVSMDLLKKLRARTSAPMGECTQALKSVSSEVKSEKDILEKATDWLRKKGISTAAKKSGRAAAEGLIAVKLNEAEKFGVVVEVNSETDFVSRSPEFQTLVGRAASAAFLSTRPSSGSSDLDVKHVLSTESHLEDKREKLQDSFTSIVSSMRENIQLRRASQVGSDNGVVVAYMHKSVDAPAKSGIQIGRMATLISLDADGAISSQQRDAMKQLGKQIAMHLAAVTPAPRYLAPSHVPQQVLDNEKQIIESAIKQAQQPADGKKPPAKKPPTEAAVKAQAAGKLKKWIQDSCLLEQPFLLAEEGGKSVPTIQDLVKEFSKAHNLPSVKVSHFLRYECGDGVVPDQATAKPSFADEVASKLRQHN